MFITLSHFLIKCNSFRSKISYNNNKMLSARILDILLRLFENKSTISSNKIHLDHSDGTMEELNRLLTSYIIIDDIGIGNPEVSRKMFSLVSLLTLNNKRITFKEFINERELCQVVLYENIILYKLSFNNMIETLSFQKIQRNKKTIYLYKGVNSYLFDIKNDTLELTLTFITDENNENHI